MNDMIVWANLALLVVSSVLFTVYYVKSVGPAQLATRVGEIAYQLCTRYRMISSVFMCVTAGNFVAYRFLPLPLPISPTFPWGWKVSAFIAVLIAIPSGYLMYRGMRDAGAETLRPRKEHSMYGGIYQRIRHPQAVGEFPFWWVIAFLVDSPFLAIVSFLYVPVWYYMCRAEEKDLLIRYGDSYAEYMKRVGFWFPKRRIRE
jgi:protein-S-isoprenylcysteine O-methyltransferase Ste14